MFKSYPHKKLAKYFVGYRISLSELRGLMLTTHTINYMQLEHYTNILLAVLTVLLATIIILQDSKIDTLLSKLQ